MRDPDQPPSTEHLTHVSGRYHFRNRGAVFTDEWFGGKCAGQLDVDRPDDHLLFARLSERTGIDLLGRNGVKMMPIFMALAKGTAMGMEHTAERRPAALDGISLSPARAHDRRSR